MDNLQNIFLMQDHKISHLYMFYNLQMNLKKSKSHKIHGTIDNQCHWKKNLMHNLSNFLLLSRNFCIFYCTTSNTSQCQSIGKNILFYIICIMYLINCCKWCRIHDTEGNHFHFYNIQIHTKYTYQHNLHILCMGKCIFHISSLSYLHNIQLEWY